MPCCGFWRMRPLARRLREGARRYAEKNLAMSDYIAGYEKLIGRLTRG